MLDLAAISMDNQPCVARFDTPVKGDGFLKIAHQQGSGASVAIYALTQHGAKPCAVSCISEADADWVKVDTKELPQNARIQVIFKKARPCEPLQVLIEGGVPNEA